VRSKPLSQDAQADIARIQEMWSDCRARYGDLGLYLFGPFTAADAMYAPVIHRLRTYAIPVAAPVRDYMATMQALPAFRQWTEAGLAETIIIERFEDAEDLR
jgi:glutathione S-transferase